MLSVFVPKTCHLACLLRPLWHLGGPSSDPGGLRSTRRETLGSRRGFLSIWGEFRERIFKAVGNFWNRKCVFCYACLQVIFLMISGSASGCLGLHNQAFGIRSVSKTTFHICWDSVDFGVIFYVF